MLRPSHVLCRVQNLATAVADFTNEGFSVRWGSRPEIAHNAFIDFESGIFIELFTPFPPSACADCLLRSAAWCRRKFCSACSADAMRYHDRWVRGRGLCDWAVELHDAVPATAAAPSGGTGDGLTSTGSSGHRTSGKSNSSEPARAAAS